ncbi:unnamed protein product [Hermetia illucens]|uniref:Peptidase S1 domain-containing protein n=1 Tax=Hermetia illucens TaxID=343691 RepID=A0A7R8UFL0_HERIL|nr:unnamed protein product [Hermetia illucens]
MIAALLAHNDTYVCTGTIVTMLHILTAAHCFFNVVPQNVAFGDVLLYPGKNYSNSTRRISSIRSFVIHPDYQINSTYENDIAIVQIAEPIVPSDVTQLVYICDEVPEVDQDCLSVGWDTDFIKRKDNQSIFLVFHQATIQPEDTCESNVKHSSNTLCTEKKSGEYLVSNNSPCSGQRISLPFNLNEG